MPIVIDDTNISLEAMKRVYSKYSNKPKSYKHKSLLSTERSRSDYWHNQINRIAPHEAKLHNAVKRMFSKQKSHALLALQGAVNRNHVLLAPTQARNDYIEIASPLLIMFLQNEMENGYQFVNPDGTLPPLVNQAALDWLKTRIGWAADQIGEESASQLSQILHDGYAQGLSMQDIASNIQDATCFSDARSMLVARTEIMQASNYGNVQGYKAAGVQQVQWLGADDERECSICYPMNGEIFDIDDAPPLPASTHPACRCIYTVVIQ